MSGLFVVAIALIVLAAAALVISATRRRDLSSATGELSRETLQRDASRRRAEAPGEASPGATGREIERAALVGRAGTTVVATTSTAPTVWVPPDPEAVGVTRRQFLNRSIVGLMGLSIASFAAASFTAFLWPIGSAGFGGKIVMGKVSDLLSDIKANGGFLYKPEGRLWLTAYPESALPKAQIAFKGQSCLPGMEAGLVALWQKCPHLGCRVPECRTSQWFECPCHGSQFNQAGEKKAGPAPRGMDRFGVEIGADGSVTVNTGDINQGPPIGTNTTGQEAQGPHCV
jgi:cytochrome b6-f complex iron-sulfur subunit